MGTITLQAAPAVEPLTVAEAKKHLRVTTSDDDGLIGDLIAVARQALDGRDGTLGRALITQTMELSLDAFPSVDTLRIPRPPLQSVTHVKYIDDAGAEQTFAASKYHVDTKAQPGRVVLTEDESWPTTDARPNAVTVRFVAGYGAAGSDVPAPIRHAIRLMVAAMYQEPTPGVVRKRVDGFDIEYADATLKRTLDNLLVPFKVTWGIG